MSLISAALAPVSVAHALGGFERWAAARLLAPAALPCTAPAVEDHPDRFEPTTREAWENTGFALGRDGVLADVEDAFPDASPRDVLIASFDFYMGQHAGYTAFARNAGFEAGADGRSDALPESIPSRFAAAYELGHSAGIAERRARGESLEEWYAELAADAEEAEYERELAHLAREAGGWDRLIGRCPE